MHFFLKYAIIIYYYIIGVLCARTGGIRSYLRSNLVLRLKALEMQGFKSFPDKTVLTFDSGITAVVGPNGSGKSNITDAVRWVLGEMSTKSIRGSKMEDVIFGGSDNRRPMGYAEVTLIIDNTMGIGRLDSEYDEVSVTRRYYRGGDSEYLINGKACRLKDIAELFMNTGVGKTGYSNIGQGKISEIISQKSDERRFVFEEAAGISKYRARKNEAERKLKDTEANLLRLSDIIGELSSRVGPLEKEAAAARKYLDLYEQKKEVDVALWLYDAETMRSRANETERAYMASKMSLEGIEGEISALEAKSENLYTKASKGMLEAEEIGEKVSAYVEKRHGIESNSRVLENDILHTESRIEQTKNEAEMRRLSLSDGEKRDGALKDELGRKTAELEVLKKEIAELEGQIEDKKALIDLCEEKILENEDEEKLIEARLIDEKVRLSALEGSHESGSGRGDSLSDEIASVTESIAVLTDSINRTEKTANEYREGIVTDKAKLAENETKTAEIRAELEEVRAALNRLTLSAESKNQRADALKRMDDLLEGYGYSVKNVMHGAEKGALSGICGPISKIISVKAEYSVAIETALGSNIQNIVTENEESAKAAIAYLKRTNGGRATFYPITAMKAQGPAVSPDELKKHKGYIGMADEICDHDKKYHGIIGYLLGRTAVFDNIDDASYVAKAFGYRIRIVTLDGQLINAGGSYTGGSVKQDSGILTRSAEISALRAESAKLGIEIEANNAHTKELTDSLDTIANDSASVNERIELMNILLQAETTQLEVTKTKKENEELRLSALEAELEGLGKENERYDDDRRQIEELIASISSELEGAKENTALAIKRRNDEDDLLSKLVSRYNGDKISEASVEKDVEALNSAISLNESTVMALKEQIERSEELSVTLEKRLQDIKGRIKENKVTFETLADDISGLEAERSRLISQNVEYEKLQARIREELRDKNHIRETVFREYTKLEGQRESITIEHDRLAAKIWEDYELTYSAAAELGYAPVTEETRPTYGARQNELKNKLRALGHVNVGAIEEYADVKERYDFNTSQFEDLTKARESLDGIIERLEREMKNKFISAFEDINKNFKVTFKELFGGGTAEISLTDPENVLTSGIEIKVAPPGKIIKNLISLSGGEQSFVAIALIFAILNVNPTPFCIFDEIESALDEVNVIRLAEYMHRYSEKTQFISITHRRGTMEAADMLYGITMPDRGISKVLSMNVKEVEKKMGGELN